MPAPSPDSLRAYLADRDTPCPGCGYNLRGLEEGTCPECGFGFNLRALIELDRRQRFRRTWRRALALDYWWLGAAAAFILCGAVVAAQQRGGALPTWLTLFQMGGPKGPWTSSRGTGWAIWIGALAAVATSWAQEHVELMGPGLQRKARRAVWGLLGTHIGAAALSLLL